VKKILFGVMTLVIVLGLVGGGAFAAFSDSETSTGNIFTAGTLDLELSGTYGSSADSLPVELNNMAPGDSTAITFNMHNAGTIAGDLSFSISYIEADGTEPADVGLAQNIDADTFAKGLLLLSPVTYTPAGGAAQNLWTQLKNEIGGLDGAAGNLSIYDLAHAGSLPMGEVLTAGGTASVVLTVQLDSVIAGNSFQGDGIAVTFTGDLAQ
jgi:spore coat-associated protein N